MSQGSAPGAKRPEGRTGPAMNDETPTTDAIMRGRGLAECLVDQDCVLCGKTLRQAPAAL
jgi:hypothetical protein